MKILQNGYRYREYYRWEKTKNNPYNYERNGLLNKLLSPSVYNTNNPITKFILNVYEKSVVFMMKYVDILKNFKNYNWKNR